MSTNNSEQTTVETVDVDIDSWLNAPDAGSVVTAAEDSKPNMFSSSSEDLSFLDETITAQQAADGETPKPTGEQIIAEIDAAIQNPESGEEADDKPEGAAAGRPKSEKSALVSFFKKRIEANEMVTFDDFDDKTQTLDEYLGGLTEKDLEELYSGNIQNMKEEIASQTPKEFFESLPDELQYAAKYVMDGGQDLKGIFKALAHVEEVRDLDPAKDEDQEQIVRQFLQATNWGTPEEIDEEVVSWKDLGQLEKKAKHFKPKLDQMHEEIVQSKIAEQEIRKQKQEEASQAYVQNVFDALRPGELNGLKLDKKVQSFLYNGLVSPQYPSITGRQTNLLGHLLEKYQFQEPNYPLIAEALWLLSNPDDYRSSLMTKGKNENVEATVRQLKTEQSRKNNTSVQADTDKPGTRKIARNTNIFKR